MRFIPPCLHQFLRATIIALMNEGIYEMNRILNHGYEIKLIYDPRSYERNFSNCGEKPVKFRPRFLKRRLALIARVKSC